MFSARANLVRALRSCRAVSSSSIYYPLALSSANVGRQSSVLVQRPLPLVLLRSSRQFSSEPTPPPRPASSSPPSPSPSNTPPPAPAPEQSTPQQNTPPTPTSTQTPTPAPTPATEPPTGDKEEKEKGKDGKSNVKRPFDQQTEVGWFHNFSSEKPFNNTFGGVGMFFRDQIARFFFRKLAQINKELQAEDVLEGAKQVYKILYAIAFKGEDSSRLDGALNPSAATHVLHSLQQLTHGRYKILGELHDITNVRFLTTRSYLNKEEEQFYLVVGLELETLESFEILHDGMRTVKEAMAKQYPVLFFETPLCKINKEHDGTAQSEPTLPSPLQWKLTLG